MFFYTSAYFDDPPQQGRTIDFWMHPPASQPLSLFFVHGGGWRHGHREDMHPIMQAFYQKGFRAASVNYRLNGVTIAEQLSDVRHGLALFHDQLKLVEDSPRIVLFGGSAGAHLALLAALAEPGACGDGARRERISVEGVIASSAPVTFEPWDEILPSIARSMEVAAGSSYSQNPKRFRDLSPLSHLGADAPALLFLLAEREHMFPNELTLEFVQNAASLGVHAEAIRYLKAEHGFFYDVQRPCQIQAFADCLRFLALMSEGKNNLGQLSGKQSTAPQTSLETRS